MSFENQKRCLLAGFVTLALIGGFASCANDTGQKKAEEKTSSSDTTTVQQTPAVADTSRNHDTTAATRKAAKIIRTGKASAAYAMSPGSKVEKGKDGIYAVSEKMPEYPSREEGLSRFVEQHINYPQTAVEDDTEGTVPVSFVVDESGKVMNPTPIGPLPAMAWEKKQCAS